MSKSRKKSQRTKSQREMHQVHLYVGNHRSLDGIEEYISLVETIFGKYDYTVNVVDKLVPGEVNILVDEFTNFYENQMIAECKRKDENTKYLFILTEFIEKNKGVLSFNAFGNMLSLAFISFFNIYIKTKRIDFASATLKDYWVAALYSPILFFYLFGRSMAYLWQRAARKDAVPPHVFLFRRFGKQIYFHIRFVGLVESLKYADSIVVSHECIYHGLCNIVSDAKRYASIYDGVLYPEIDKGLVLERLMEYKALQFEVTGTISRYRQKCIDKLNAKLSSFSQLYCLKDSFDPCIAIGFGDASKRFRKGAAFSLHPPQTKKWPYSSPTRIYRALTVDNNIPVLTKYFGQNPIEDVCVTLDKGEFLMDLYSMYIDREYMKEKIGGRIDKYNEVIGRRNEELVNAITERLY